jgi:7-cyano-7-deazaguanine synthase
MTHHSALVLFSGGQDSTICLADALSRYQHVETIGFNYGQRHSIELTCREDVLSSMQELIMARGWPGQLAADHVLDIPALAQIGGSALTETRAIQMADDGLPTTFVPGRNIVFFTYAAALAYRRDIRVLMGGMCETDYSGYPDCRRATLDAVTSALNLGMETAFEIETPLMYLDKAESWAFADRLGGRDFIDLIIEKTHSCYRGERTHRHAWGYGCDDCPACDLRANGYHKWVSS